jgi:hypothetical protein
MNHQVWRDCRTVRLKVVVCIGVAALVSGCGGSAGFHPSGGTGTQSAAKLTGRVLGGQFPVQGAEVQLYAAGSTGYGSGAQALLSSPVSTDQYGGFTLPDFDCPANNPETYLVATGGDPGIGVDNPAIALMAALGPCGNIDSIPFVNMDEVTTVASVWALAPFLGPNAQVGTSATNATGLTNAFSTVNNLVDITQGTAPGPSPPTGSTIPVGKIYSLADILSTCINSAPTAACDTLFTDATPENGTEPGNTIDAALEIARNPGNAVSKLFMTITPSPPFGGLASAPPDWTLAVTLTGGGLNHPASIAVDLTGDVWTSNYCGSGSACSSVSEFSPSGAAVSPSTGYASGALWESYGMAIDYHGNVWVASEQTSYSVNSGSGSLTELNSSGAVTSPANGDSGGGIDFPIAVATDSEGEVWTANEGDSTASLLSNSGSAISSGSGWGSGDGLAGPVAVAVDSGRNAWFADEEADGGTVSCVSPSGSPITTISSGGYETAGIAVDAVGTGPGHVWAANYSSSSISELTITGTCAATVVSTGYTGGGLDHPNGIAVDGAGNVWAANYFGNSVTELQGAGGTNPGQAISPSAGFASDADLREPYGLALDASGNLWLSNFGLSTVTEIVGATTPVATPLTGPASLP